MTAPGTHLRTTRGAATARTTGRTARGFTLVELLVVVAILTVMLGTAGITGGTTSGQALELAEVQVEDALQMARNLAFSVQEPHGVVFDVTNERFAVVALDGEAVEDPLDHGPYEVHFLGPDQPEGLDLHVADFGATGAAAVFDAAGVPVDGGRVVLRHGQLERTLNLDAATGRVSAP